MLEHIRIENFRCLKEVDVPLRPLTVLIGPNDSGKTAFLAALHTITGARSFETTRDLWRGDYSVRREFGIAATLESKCIDLRYDEGRGSFTPRFVELLSNGKERDLPLPSIRTQLFRLPSNGVPMECPGVASSNSAPTLDSYGGGVPALLDYWLRTDRVRLSSFIDAIRNSIAGLEDILIATPKPEIRRLDLKLENNFEIPADHASTGVRLMLFFIALAFHTGLPDLILIEEPENGVHPRRLKEIVDLLRAVTIGGYGGRRAQVVLTTHSPYLLDFIDIQKDQVLVFRRKDDGSRTAGPIDSSHLREHFLDEFHLGEVWFNSGESAMLGKTE